MASTKKIKTSSQFSNNKQSNYFKENSYNSENIKNNEENQINNNYIEKSFLEDLLKCELCDNIFDLNIHTPIVIKCGHTFCKNCVLNIYNNKNKEINNSLTSSLKLTFSKLFSSYNGIVSMVSLIITPLIFSSSKGNLLITLISSSI